MGIDTMENVVTLLAVIIGLMYTLFQYIKTPKRGWMFLSVFFLTHLLSDYYWTTYTLVMGDNPAVSAMMAYFGWNVGYLFLLLLAIDMRPDNTRGFIHPVMFIPIPLGIAQFFLYIQFGGIFNNLWEGILATSTAVVSLQVIARYSKTKSSGAPFPTLHLALLLFIITEYGMWTASCFSWPSPALNPYIYFSLGNSVVVAFLGWAANKTYKSDGTSVPEGSPQETRFTVLLQATVSIIIFFGSIAGYYIGLKMKEAIPTEGSVADSYEKIAITLFVISVFLVAFILMIILMTALSYRSIDSDMPVEAAIRQGRFNFIFTIIITLSLMTTTVVYTSRLFYNVSVNGALEDGQTRVYSTSVDLENYLTVATSTLLVVSDSVELMLENDQPSDYIRHYIEDQTTYQKEQFNEDLTGFYAYINGEYMDGIGWVPPAGYDATQRDWYRAAVDANGEITIVPPYVDAQSHEIVITICKLLNDGGRPGDYNNRYVVALDLIVNHIQDIIQGVSIGGKGYAMVVDQNGLVVAHHEPELNGQNATDLYGSGFMDAVMSNQGSSSEASLGGEDYTIFVEPVMDQWYVVIAISNRQLLAETYHQLGVNIVVSLIIFILISFFYFLGYKNEQLNAQKMEDMRAAGLKQTFEAESLKQKEAAADEANKAKSQFLAQMSHEIRTPINAVLGMNEMILRLSRDEEILEYAENIDSAGNTLLALINSILDFSKIEDRKMDIIPVDYDTSSLIRDLVNSIAQRAEAKDLQLRLNIDETLPRRLHGDDVRITQVIMNLLTNAVKYTDKGTITLTIKKDISDEERIRLYVGVQDTGIGIRPEDIDRLSLSFERLDQLKNRNIEGTGLGMSIVSSLLGMMGSHINVESTYGQGSLFYFTLDQGIVDPTPMGQFVNSIDKAHHRRSEDDLISAPHASVLVVDDNSLNLKVAENLLKLCKIDPDAVASGKDAIEKMASHKYDIVFLDHMMPKMDGIETLNELKKKSLIPPDTRMVVLTANAVLGARENYIKEGFDDYLSKPVALKDMVKLLKEYLPRSAYDSYADDGTLEFSSGDTDKAIDTGYDLELLKDAGLDVETGLAYSADDDGIYYEMLNDFTAEYDSRQKTMCEDFEKKDWTEYRILAHALKSNLKAIGAEDAAKKAFALESAAANLDVVYLEGNHAEMMEEYKKTVDIIRNTKV
ncbi:MAG: response regulator [Lachnospiraceae bacterium]|nr:response regulator [Lachnospiraceae bacterium]